LNDDSIERDEFRRLGRAAQIYIVRALDFGLPRNDPMQRWQASDLMGMAMQLAHANVYFHLAEIRERIRDQKQFDSEFSDWELIRLCARIDIKHDEMGNIAAFRFLYERLFGPPIRPWITSVFLEAATSPVLTADWRRRCVLSVTDADLDDNDDRTMPLFYPDIGDLIGDPPL
jgi:hypothetical protein